MRRAPGSRHAPQFNAGPLEGSLRAAGIAYVHLAELGGRRNTTPGSPNGAWTNASFRGYADHMATPEFERGIGRLLDPAAGGPTACMCAEAVWWQCHRRLIADALVARGHDVRHIMPDGRLDPHELMPAAVVDGTRVTYPPRQPSLGI